MVNDYTSCFHDEKTSVLGSQAMERRVSQGNQILWIKSQLLLIHCGVPKNGTAKTLCVLADVNRCANG